jgi:hypothetical protein
MKKQESLLATIGWVVLWIVLCILAAIGVAIMITDSRADDLGLRWNPPPTGGPLAEGYHVYRGAASRVYDLPPADVGNVLLWETADAPGNCTLQYYAVTAYNSAGESEYSSEVSSIARPQITDVTQNVTGVHTILGTNFDTSAKVYVKSGAEFVQLDPADVQRVSCTEIRIPADPVVDVRVANVAQPVGSGEPQFIFSLPWPGPQDPTVE